MTKCQENINEYYYFYTIRIKFFVIFVLYTKFTFSEIIINFQLLLMLNR